MTQDEPKCIHVSFHDQAAQTPDAVCLIEEDLTFTYAEVQRRVILLAKELRDNGSCTNAVVAIFMEPCADYIISMLAVLTAGAAYVPLELAYPITMLQRVLHDATPVAVVTKQEQRALLPVTNTALAVLCLDDNEHHELQETAGQPESQAELLQTYQSFPPVSLDDLAFIVYSSGTTGQPKGIANPHRAPALSYRWRFDEFVDPGPGSIVACNVFFVWEALRAVMRGGAVVPVPASIVFDGEALSVFLHQHSVTEMLFTPSLLENFFNTMSEADLRARLVALKTIFLNGEVVTLNLRERCFRLLPSVRFINLYSISECHEVGAVDLREIDLNLSTKYCPIGAPCTYSPAYILDDEGRHAVAPGDAGELYIGGDMLAVGYLNLPELTATRFVPDPFRPDEGCMYRTGDRARMLENGQLEILGRCDFMVKIRGYSIVLGAVEAALVETVSLSSCVVVADGEEGEDKHLVAYLVRAPHEDVETRLSHWSIDTRTGACPEIRRAVDGALPHYMVPSVFVEVETLPVSAVGAKLDRKALQAQSADRRAMLRSLQLSAETHTTPLHTATSHQPARWKRVAKHLRVPHGSSREDVEDVMLILWEVVLDREPGMLDSNSDFHEHGGHSLSAARLVSLMNKTFSCRLLAVQLMQGMSIGTATDAVVASWLEDPISNGGESGSNRVHQMNGSGGTIPNGALRTADEDQIIQQVRGAAVLPEDIIPKSQGFPTRGLGESKEVFLTGSTGFLGAHVLAELLLKYPSATVVCLARSKDPKVVQINLERYKLWQPEFSTRIKVVSGDLSLAKLGLDLSSWKQITQAADAVVHCGAAVSLTSPYAMLEAVNVYGTLNIIRLACECKAGTPLIYVSSNGIFPCDKGKDEIFLENDDVGCLPDRLGAMNGYGLSKWVAEQLVVAAHKRGLPTMTIRFGNLGWQSTSGIGNSLDFQSIILNGARRMVVRPRVKGWKFEITPIDFAAAALVGLADTAIHLKAGSIFNCVQSELVDADRVFGWVSESDTLSLLALDFEDWQQRVDEASNDDLSLSTLQAFAMGLPGGASYLSECAHLDCSKFDAAVASLHPPLRRLGPSELSEYFKIFLSANPIISSVAADSVIKPSAVDPSVSTEHQGPLAGQVAVVTGASSGIGRAIVLSLVQAGCNVAMAARRLSELEKTQKEVAEACSGSPVKMMCVRTDVTKRDEVAHLVQVVEVSLGPIDIMVNCAGVMYFTLMKNVVWDQWEAQVDVNCKGTMYGIGSVLPRMLDRGKGHIVNITSDAGRKAFPGLAVYSGSKFFVEGVSQALRAETASTGLRVTCIQPGNVETPLLSKSTDPDGLAEYGTPTGAKVLEPADIGRAVVYAVSQPEWCAVNEILVEPREEPA
jgi:amino acid adenylation domain-containing protein/thioester reductase-like protein